MSDITEAVGTLTEGGLYARAIEPKSGEGNGISPDAVCLNCDAAMIGPYCHNCGQPARIHRTIGAFLHDLLHGALHFEGKIWHTLPMLFFRPGALTRRYIAGERARFVSPMALFLFAVFLMFAVFQAVGITAPTDIEAPPQMEKGLAKAKTEAQTALETDRKALAQAPVGSEEFARAEQAVKEDEATVRALEGTQTFVLGDSGTNKLSLDKSGWDWLDKGLDKWRKHPELMLYKLQANSYKFSWLLIPLSIPFVWLMFFWRRQYKAYDHAIFVTYSLAFMSLLFVALSVMGVLGVSSAAIGLAAMLIPPLHMYKQLRVGYALSRFSAGWRVIVLLICVCVILVLFLQLLVVIGAF